MSGRVYLTFTSIGPRSTFVVDTVIVDGGDCLDTARAVACAMRNSSTILLSTADDSPRDGWSARIDTATRVAAAKSYREEIEARAKGHAA